MSRMRFVRGHALNVLTFEPENSYDVCVTSPAYWRQKEYGAPVVWPGEARVCELGQEPHVEDYVRHLRLVLDQVHRVLKPTGSLWLNLGDCRYGKPGNGRGGETKIGGGIPNRSAGDKVGFGMKTKDLAGVPWRVAFALQGVQDVERINSLKALFDLMLERNPTEGLPLEVMQAMDALVQEARGRIERSWHLQSVVIWHKMNAVPEGAPGRPTDDFEYVFRLSKGPLPTYNSTEYSVSMFNASVMRRQRAVWSIATDASKGHPASMPVQLAVRCIQASLAPGTTGAVLDPFCGIGTTLLAGANLGCTVGLGIDTSADNIELARSRLGGGGLKCRRLILS